MTMAVKVEVGGLAVELSVGEAVLLAGQLLDQVADLRRGMIDPDGVAWCCCCGRNTVNPSEGFDTCDECLARV